MPTIPAGSYTRQQIRNLALNRAGNRALDTDAISWLSQLLFDLATLYDWPFLCVTTSLVISGSSFTLPEDFFTSQDDNALKPLLWQNQSVNGPRILEVDRATFDVRDSATSYGQPSFWTVDRSTNTGYVTPNPVPYSLTAQLRYRRVPVEPDAEDEADDRPWFPWHDYLVQAIFVTALEHERDPRVPEAMGIREQMFARIRRGAMPRMAEHATIPLDPTHFRAPFQGD